MSTQSSGKTLWLVLGAVVVVGLATLLLRPRGYGEVSDQCYEIATALYGACLAESEPRIRKVQQILDDLDTDENPLTPKERHWLQDIVDTALNGKWQRAANQARRMMNDQVKPASTVDSA